MSLDHQSSTDSSLPSEKMARTIRKSSVAYMNKRVPTDVTLLDQNDNTTNTSATNQTPQDSDQNSDDTTENPDGSSVTNLVKLAALNKTLQDQVIVNVDTTSTNETTQYQDGNADPEKNENNKQQYKYLVKRFNFKIVLSTFASTLVVAYISFVNNVARTVSMSRIQYAHSIPYNILMLLAYLSISLHALSIIISSRCAVLCSDPDLLKEQTHTVDGSKDPDSNEKQRYTVDGFKNILSLCQHLNLYGIILFAFAVLGSSFFVFEDYAYPGVFCVFSLVVVALIFTGKYRELSLINEDLTWFCDLVKTYCRK